MSTVSLEMEMHTLGTIIDSTSVCKSPSEQFVSTPSLRSAPMPGGVIIRAASVSLASSHSWWVQCSLGWYCSIMSTVSLEMEMHTLGTIMDSTSVCKSPSEQFGSTPCLRSAPMPGGVIVTNSRMKGVLKLFMPMSTIRC